MSEQAQLNVLQANFQAFNVQLFASERTQHYVSAPWFIVALLSLLSSVLIVAGLPGVCARECARTGWL
jgi:hypothetical protein